MSSSEATASDNYDGDITASIVIDATAVNTAVLGSYSVTYDVTDSSGNPAGAGHEDCRCGRHDCAGDHARRS